MKKIIILLVFFQMSVYGQTIVNDPAANASLAQQVQNGLTNLKLTSDNLEIAKKNLDKLEKVNQIIQQTKLVGSIKDNLETTYVNLENVPERIKRVKLKILNDKLFKMTKNLVTDVSIFKDLLIKVLKDNVLSMKDSERIDLLMKLLDRSKELKSKSLNLAKHIKNYSNI